MIDELRLRCEAITEDRFCNKPAQWIATWSDREMIVCDDHKSQAQEAHDNDHEDDRTGIEWRKVIY
jgi:hypothetical protein